MAHRCHRLVFLTTLFYYYLYYVCSPKAVRTLVVPTPTHALVQTQSQPTLSFVIKILPPSTHTHISLFQLALFSIPSFNPFDILCADNATAFSD